MILEKGANGQSCLTEIEFDIGAATACFLLFCLKSHRDILQFRTVLQFQIDIFMFFYL